MDAVFIDTTILANLLDIPNLNEDRCRVQAELDAYLSDRENTQLILPLASIIEAGNHIAHVSDGNLRRKVARKLSTFINRTLANDAPWVYYGKELDEESLMRIAENFPGYAMREISLADYSIILAYEKYKEDVPLRSIKIWSQDHHLSSYYEVFENQIRRRSR